MKGKRSRSVMAYVYKCGNKWTKEYSTCLKFESKLVTGAVCGLIYQCELSLN